MTKVQRGLTGRSRDANTGHALHFHGLCWCPTHLRCSGAGLPWALEILRKTMKLLMGLDIFCAMTLFTQ